MPTLMSASFALKVLRHEGLFAFADHCSQCQILLSEKYLYCGETYCRSHAPPPALFLCIEELQLLTFLAFCRDLTQLEKLVLPLSVLIKAQELFKHSI
jgi:DNA repair protein RecO (recombination protein O)